MCEYVIIVRLLIKNVRRLSTCDGILQEKRWDSLSRYVMQLMLKTYLQKTEAKKDLARLAEVRKRREVAELRRKETEEAGTVACNKMRVAINIDEQLQQCKPS